MKKWRESCQRLKCLFPPFRDSVGPIISILALIVATASLWQTYRSAEIAEDARDAARLEQRAWLGYRKITLAAHRDTDPLCRPTPDGSWENREPRRGDCGRIRLFVSNTGKTPATNVRFLYQTPMLIRDGAELEPSEPLESEWEIDGRETIVVPGTEERFQELLFRLKNEARYVDGTHALFVWVRMEYCDVAQRNHWTQIGAMHRYGEPLDVFWTLSQSISPSDSGEPDYKRCPSPR